MYILVYTNTIIRRVEYAPSGNTTISNCYMLENAIYCRNSRIVRLISIFFYHQSSKMRDHMRRTFVTVYSKWCNFNCKGSQFKSFSQPDLSCNLGDSY